MELRNQRSAGCQTVPYVSMLSGRSKKLASHVRIMLVDDKQAVRRAIKQTVWARKLPRETVSRLNLSALKGRASSVAAQ